MSDWLFLSVAAILGLLGLWLLYWSLLRDRFKRRGRRRCPKCWYDMSGTPESLTCSECGYVAGHERKLRKTRRRWRWALVALVILFIATSTAVVPKVKRGGWKAAVPTTALVLAMPGLEKSSPQLAKELQNRFDTGRMFAWQVSLLFRRLVDTANPPWSIQILTRARWPADVDARYLLGMKRQPSTVSWVDGLSMRLRATPRLANGTPTFVISSPGGGGFVCKWHDPAAGVSLDAANWRSRGGSIGRLTADTTRVVFDLELECERLVPGRGRVWTPVWRGQQALNLTVHGSIADCLKPVRSPEVDAIIREKQWVMGMDSILRVIRTYGPLPGLGDHAALGMNFEVLHNGQVVARTSGWWGNNDAPRLSEVLAWDWKAQGIPALRNDAGGEWLMRIRSDPALALLAFDDRGAKEPDADTCWEGEVVIPLHVGYPSGYLVPQRDLIAPGQWGWMPNRASTQRD